MLTIPVDRLGKFQTNVYRLKELIEEDRRYYGDKVDNDIVNDRHDAQSKMELIEKYRPLVNKLMSDIIKI